MREAHKAGTTFEQEEVWHERHEITGNFQAPGECNHLSGGGCTWLIFHKAFDSNLVRHSQEAMVHPTQLGICPSLAHLVSSHGNSSLSGVASEVEESEGQSGTGSLHSPTNSERSVVSSLLWIQVTPCWSCCDYHSLGCDIANSSSVLQGITACRLFAPTIHWMGKYRS